MQVGEAESSEGSEGTASNVHVVLDIAHNEDAIAALAATARLRYPHSPLRVVLGMSADKDVDRCLPPLLRLVGGVGRIHCTQARHPRAMGHAELSERVQALAVKMAEGSSSTPTPTPASAPASVSGADIRQVTREAMQAAAVDAQAQGAQGGPGVVIVCGSAFIMAEVRAEIGVVEPKDGDVLFHTASDGAFADAQEYFSPVNPVNPVKAEETIKSAVVD
ncbi:hypothetical protein B484DRAFT_45937 [Ochromonadaceae sp. CCMP2298]|nr:hypothetical protein B484DRAFT_45937 [Ochromonadaceae sp. CCMP2298]